MPTELEALQEAFRAALAGRIAALEALRGQPLEAGGPTKTEARRMAHALRGAGGTYGFPQVSEAAAACEEAPPGALAARLDTLLGVLRRVAAVPAARSDRLVLVVEDDIAVSALLQLALTAPGRRVFAVQTTAAAQMVLEDYALDLILLDLVLPDADGRTFLGELRAVPRSARVPIVVLSALTSESVREECLGLGADAYVHKPLDPMQVRTLVGALLEAGPRAAGPRAPVTALPEPAIPAPKGADAAAAPAPATPRPAGPILVAEDDELMAAVLLHRLVREGFDVRRYADGAAAFAAARAEPHALLVLDVKMPAMDGFEVLERVRALPGYADVPILMLTSMGQEKDVERGLALGADDYIVKPFSPVELVARVKRQLRR